MKKIITKVASLALVTALILSSTIFAASSDFNNKKVDSNEWTFITSCTKETEYNEVYVKITQSDYKKLRQSLQVVEVFVRQVAHIPQTKVANVQRL
jgi:hypothetical protein